MAISKTIRQQVFNKYGGKCAYCGCELVKGWHVDHNKPIHRYWKYRREQNGRILKDENGNYIKDLFVQHPERDCVDNMMPACRRCNGWKSTYTIEQFRDEISEQTKRARSYSCNFRMAEDFGLIKETLLPVVFFFEKFNSDPTAQECDATKLNSSNTADNQKIKQLK